MDRLTYMTQLQQLTSTIMEELYEADYEKLEAFVEERQVIIDGLVKQFSSQSASLSEKMEIEQLLGNDNEIVARMNVLRLEAQDWLHKRGQAKTQRNAYESGYTPDSFLMDKKK
ncbi:flagellar protein FliT [Paenibacillus sp. F6_3S_P_1C]|uniref:Flagellar protein FliT n=1 Tax=Paenibacillus vandeheii TaxID=3035917 RepID=A0ABT8JF66_9BACL|nr:flagellar protein FliT [Paenibacillus vandeheii]MDN4603741.1 flagellar protein FliT [Paenibacillus vandeheii]